MQILIIKIIIFIINYLKTILVNGYDLLSDF